MPDQVQKVPMPDGWTRPETGPMQFGDDWPGVFIRGDNALAYSLSAGRAVEALRQNPNYQIEAAMLAGLMRVLQSCRVEGS